MKLSNHQITRNHRKPFGGWRFVGSASFAALLCTFAGMLANCGNVGNTDNAQSSSGSDRELVELHLLNPPSVGPVAHWLATQQHPLRKIIKWIDGVRQETNKTGMFLRIGEFKNAWSHSLELVAALKRLRESGKLVHCHLQSTDNTGYLLAAAGCDRITLSPSGMLNVVGPALQVTHAKDLLDKIGVQADLLQMGDYKGAADPLTRSNMSPQVRSSLEALVQDLHATLVAAVAKGRSLNPDTLRAAINDGPLDAATAVQLGMVDAIGFDDEARGDARRATSTKRVKQVGLEGSDKPLDFGELFRNLSAKRQEDVSGPRVALLHAIGPITHTNEELFEGIASGPMIRAIRRLTRDGNVRAVVLHIDSPGGSALASDEIWHALRKLAKEKPLIASIGGMAASGGYYIASAARHILAHRASLVGSIGVVGGKISFSELAKKLGLQVETVQAGTNASWTSPAKTFTESERSVVFAMMKRTYERFVERVATGRGKSTDAILPAAGGRLMTATKAMQVGLVDAEGGLEQAIAMAKTKGKLPAVAEVEVWPSEQSALEWLSKLASRYGGARATSESAETEHFTRTFHADGIAELLVGKTGLFNNLALSQILKKDRIAAMTTVSLLSP